MQPQRKYDRMRCYFYNNLVGTEVASILYGNSEQKKSHHYIDALQRFRKDYSMVDRKQREQQRYKKQLQNQRRRVQYLQRQAKRWSQIQSSYLKQRQKRQSTIQQHLLGIRKGANTNGLPYNPISLQYSKNKEGQKLKTKDQDHYIRGLVRAHNMDNKGNSRFNPLTGESRRGVQKLVPQHLVPKFDDKLNIHYDGYKIKLPPYRSNNQTRMQTQI